MKSHRAPLSLEHHRLRIVEEPLAACPAERPGGAHQRPTERVHRQVEHEFAPQRPRVRQHHHEEPQSALAAGDGHRAGVRPVDLGLLADERLGAQVHFAPRWGPQRDHVLAQRARSALETALPQHVVKPRRPQPRVARQRLRDEVAVGIAKPRARRAGCVPIADPERAPDYVGVQAELCGDGAHAPVLGEVQADDLGLLFGGGGHRAPRSSSWRRSRKGPSPRGRRTGSTTSTS
jgi:hypothetical protein